jgi:uncharacterized membrane protein
MPSTSYRSSPHHIQWQMMLKIYMNLQNTYILMITDRGWRVLQFFSLKVNILQRKHKAITQIQS